MSEQKIKITSMVPYIVGLHLPEYRYSKLFKKEGQSYLIDKQVLVESFFETAVENLFRDGLLYIEDKETRIELGLETEDESVKKVSSATMLAYLKTKSAKEFEEFVEGLSDIQRDILVTIAAENKITDYEKTQILKKVTGRDVMKIVEANRED